LPQFVKRLSVSLRSEKLQRRLRTIFVYLTGQGLVQLVSLSLGMLVLRWLNVENYAQFSVAFGFQTTLGMLTDLGFAGTIIALVGSRGKDPDVVGSYIRSGRHLRNVMLVWLTPIATIVFVFIARQHHWPVVSSILLFVSIVASIYFSGMVSYYGAPLLIRSRLSHYYRHQLAGAAFRVVVCAILYFTHGLNAWTTSWTNAAGLLLIGMLNARESRPFITLPKHHLQSVTKQMVSYVMPNLPNIIFYALQGQISLFLISFFGQTRSIAEVGALGRLGQLFLLLSGFNSAVIEPFFARLREEQVLKSFFVLFAGAASICTVISLVGFLEPRWLLLLLGAKYASLERETGWLVLGSCIGYMATVVWTVCGARRWLYWTTTWVNIVTTISAQVVFLLLCKVDTTLHVIWFGVASGAGYLLSALFNVVVGFYRGPRVKTSEHSEVEQIAE
jgi:O-antigen/teichoic acid export membrane protein